MENPTTRRRAKAEHRAAPDAKVSPKSASVSTEARGKPFRLDVGAVANIEGLAQEVAVLRASIRQLAEPDTNTGEHVKILAELRHQVEALCRALKTQQALAGRESSTRADELARVLDELGDELGVPR
jgi:chemotaxis protein histidine kinase CheA